MPINAFVSMPMGGFILPMDMGMGVDMRMGMGMHQIAMAMLVAVEVGMFMGVLQSNGILYHQRSGKDHN